MMVCANVCKSDGNDSNEISGNPSVGGWMDVTG